MSLKLGSTTITKGYLGSTEITKMYLGTTLIIGGTLNLFPVLSNFTVENAQPSRVYFNSSEIITATTVTGFTISGKTISSVTIQSGLTTGHYFTVTSALTFWDNNTIRYEGGSNIVDLDSNGVYDFTLTDIENNISEPTISGIDYWVDGSVSSSGDGKSEANAFKTIAEGTTALRAGGTLYIKTYSAGYNEQLATGFSGSTPTNPVRYIGYKTDWAANNGEGDIASNYYDATTDNWDMTEMPTLISTNLYNLSISRNNVIFKNIQATSATTANLNTASANFNMYFKNINCKDDGTHTSTYNFRFLATETNDGSKNVRSNIYARVIDCVAYNASADNFNISANGVLVDNLYSYCDITSGGNDDTDYYLNIRGGNNIIINSTAYRASILVLHTGHFGVKSGSDGTNNNEDTSYNLLKGNTVIGITRGLTARNNNSKYNVFKYNTVSGHGITTNESNGGGLCMWGGASYNIWEYNTIRNLTEGIYVYNNTEGEPATKLMQGNIVRNNIFDTVEYLVYIAQTDASNTLEVNNNKLYNNTFHGVTNAFMRDVSSTNPFTSFSGNEWKNNIYQKIYDNGFTGSSMTNSSSFSLWEDFANINSNNNYNDIENFGDIASWENANYTTNNPNFVDLVDFVPQNTALNSGLILTDVDYDINDKERSKLTTTGNKLTIGAVEIDK